MGLEDLAMMRAVVGSTVLYASDAVCAEKLVDQMAAHKGICYLRTSRPKTPVIYNNDEAFPIGGAKVLRQSAEDKVTVVAAGVTLYEALKAADTLKGEGIGITVIDAYSIKPLAKDVIKAAAKKTKNLVVTVEDHYAEGGLGDAVAGELSADGVKVHKLAVLRTAALGQGGGVDGQVRHRRRRHRAAGQGADLSAALSAKIAGNPALVVGHPALAGDVVPAPGGGARASRHHQQGGGEDQNQTKL